TRDRKSFSDRLSLERGMRRPVMVWYTRGAFFAILLPPRYQETRFGSQVTVLVAGGYELHRARDGQVHGLLVERVGSHLQQQTQVVHLAFRDRQDVAAADVADGRGAGALLILTGNQRVAAIKCLRTAMAGREHAADFVDEEVPGDRLVRLFVRITHDRDEEFALHAAFIHGLSSAVARTPHPDCTSH